MMESVYRQKWNEHTEVSSRMGNPRLRYEAVIAAASDRTESDDCSCTESRRSRRSIDIARRGTPGEQGNNPFSTRTTGRLSQPHDATTIF